MARIYGSTKINSGALFRLLSGHAGDPYFRVSHTVTKHALTAAATQHSLRDMWPSQQTQGPINVTKHWLRRHGWTCKGPWRWQRSQAQLTLNLSGVDDDRSPPDVVFNLRNYNVDLLDHHLRDAWRAHQWASFLKSANRAAAQPWSAKPGATRQRT